MFSAALLTTAKTWRRPKCPSRDEWVKTQYTHTEQNGTMPSAETRTQLETTTRSEVSQKEKDNHHVIHVRVAFKIWHK